MFKRKLFTQQKINLHNCVTCQEAKVFAFSFEREAMILGVGYSTQVFAGHYYTVVVAIIYTALACRPAVKAAKHKRAELTLAPANSANPPDYAG